MQVVPATGSTNDDLLGALRERVYRGPMLLAAESQTAGRGRLGRTWSSTPGASLTASFALRVERPLSALDGVSLVCGLAVRDAIALHGVVAGLKWPNDVLVHDRKLAGILVEAVGEGESTRLVIGVGINIEPPSSASSSNGPRGTVAPTDLRSAGARDLDRNRLLAMLALELQARLVAFSAAGFAPLAEEWNQADAFRGRRVTLHARGAFADAVTHGVAGGVDERGALLLAVHGVTQRIISGDVSLRIAGSA